MFNLYVYFETDEASIVNYTVQADSYSDFSRTVESEYNYTHEFQVLDLIPNTENKIVFTIQTEDGLEKERIYTYTMQDVLGNEDIQLDEIRKDETFTSVGDGLYVVLGNDSDDQDFMTYYDTEGVLRSEIRILGYRSHRLLFQDDRMYFSISTSKIATMNNLGQIEQIYDLGDYELHHDYVFADVGNILVIASDTTSDTVEDRIVLLDVDTGQTKEVLDLEDIFSSYKQIMKRMKIGIGCI